MSAWRWSILALLMGFAALPAGAATVADLVAAGRLTVTSELQPATGLVPGQRASLYLTVSTDRWFAGGTRIDIPEVPGLVILQTNAFAANNSTTQNGQTWVSQRWTLDVYATDEGRFRTGPIDLRVQVHTGEAVARGTIEAPSVTVTASVPPALDAAQWVAAPAFAARQTLEPAGTALRPGDAITRTVTLEAEDVLDKMLPEIAPGDFEGLAAYPEPPRLDSSSNRGRIRARRVQAITYVAERPGEYQLPGYQFSWWDTGNARLQTVTLEPVALTVSGTPANEDGRFLSRISPRHWAMAGAALGLFLLVAAAWRLLPRGRLAAAAAGLWRAAGEHWRRWRAPALPRINPWR
ncbi:BatD family protein [Parahaliea mediterranea]|uniref:BatD family protein n=1 Tax=Parahaliea mediterranea TaxID=651086 RepID=A0A939DGP9_9GAMM|nr:BatD family protein [Parahaliea mediterranea]MBN7797856.1 BatD family protein [Parahaliea mediterranea]